MKASKKRIRITDASQLKAAKLAGVMFLLAFIVPTLNWAFVLSGFNVANNAFATSYNILSNELIFRLGISIELLMAIALIILGWSLYRLLKPVNKDLALLALLLKLVEATLMAVTVLLPFIALQILNEEASMSGLTIEHLQSPIGLIFNSHTAITSIPMVFLGLDMMLFSYLLYKSAYVPRILAGFGILSFVLILIHSFMHILLPEYATLPISQFIFWTPSGLFELIIGSWLLIKLKKN